MNELEFHREAIRKQSNQDWDRRFFDIAEHPECLHKGFIESDKVAVTGISCPCPRCTPRC